MAGGRLSDGYFITGDVKIALVRHAQEVHSLSVWAFGDSSLDLGMLKMADQAVVVVGEEATRSRTMDSPLEEAIDKDGLRSRQLLLPKNVSPRLDIVKLPVVQLTDAEFIAEMVGLHEPSLRPKPL
jgi:hypothetical protein